MKMLIDLENAYGSWECVGWLPYTDINEVVFAKSSMLQDIFMSLFRPSSYRK